MSRIGKVTIVTVSAFPIGATAQPDSVNFSVYADKAEAVERLLAQVCGSVRERMCATRLYDHVRARPINASSDFGVKCQSSNRSSTAQQGSHRR